MASRRSHTGLKMTSERSKFKVTIFASWLSRYRFFGSRISNIALVLDYGLSEVTYWPPNDLWEVKISKCQFLLHGCLDTCFLGQGFKKQHQFWTMASRRSHIGLQMTSERSKFQSDNFCFMGVYIQVFWVKDFKNRVSF